MLGLGVFIITLAAVMRPKEPWLAKILFVTGAAITLSALLKEPIKANKSNIEDNEIPQNSDELSVLHRTPIYL